METLKKLISLISQLPVEWIDWGVGIATTIIGLIISDSIRRYMMKKQREEEEKAIRLPSSIRTEKSKGVTRHPFSRR